MKVFAFAMASLMAISAQAGILTQTAGTKKLENVTLATSAKLSLNGQEIELLPLGAGVRTKKVLITNVKVYVAQLFSSDASTFAHTEADALASLKDSRTTVIALTFVRTVDAPTVQTSFKDALKANSEDLSDAGLIAFLDAVVKGGEATDKGTVVIAIQKNADGTETVTYENTKGETATITGSDLTRKVMSIWLGQAADSGVATLKKQLILSK